MLEQPVPEGLHPTVQARAGEALGELQPRGITVQHLVKDHAPWEGPPLEQGKVARRKEQQRSSIMPASPIHHPPVPLSTGGEGRRMEIEAEPGKKGDQDSVFSLLLVLIALLCYELAIR